MKLMQHEPCRCGCGEPRQGRSLYRPGHRAILVAARRRLREARRYALRRGIPYDLDLEAVHALVAAAWPLDAGLALRRIDRTFGFSAENIELAPARGGRRRRSTGAQLRRRCQRLAARSDLWAVVSAEELVELFEAQGGRCAVSGRRLRPAAGLDDPDALSVITVDPGEPPGPSNLTLVTALVSHAAARWGVDALIAHARSTASRLAKAAPTSGGAGRGAG